MGALLLLGVVVSGLYLMVRPGPTPIDRWVFAAIRPVHHSGFLLLVTRLGSPFVVVTAAVAGCLATVRHNRPRALALLVGPGLAVAVCDWAIKPVVGRTFAAVVSFPSGTVAAIAAIATVALLATPDQWRSVAAAVGGTVTMLACLSVVGLRWHYPTDALAGVAAGAGLVLLSDCATRAGAGLLRPKARGAGDGAGAGAETPPQAERTVTH